MSARPIVNVRKEKMPTKVFYNLETITSPQIDPKKIIVMGPSEKHRVSRDRLKLSPNASSRKEFVLGGSQVMLGTSSRSKLNQKGGYTVRFAKEADSVQQDAVHEMYLDMIDHDIVSSQSYRLNEEQSPYNAYTGPTPPSVLQISATQHASPTNASIRASNLYKGNAATDSFYSAANTQAGEASNFNKTKKMSQSMIEDETSIKERVNSIKNRGGRHELGLAKDRNGKMIIVSPKSIRSNRVPEVAHKLQSPMSKDEQEASRAMKKLKLNHSSKMLVQDQQPSEQSLLASAYMSKNKLSVGSSRLISQAAEDKLMSNISLSKLSNAERIVSMNHASESYIPPIEDTKYHQRNYLARKVIKPQEIEDMKGGEVISLITKTSSYAGAHRHVTSNSPIYQRDQDKPSQNIRAASSNDNQDKIKISLPELVASPKNQGDASKKRNSIVSQSKTMMDRQRKIVTPTYGDINPKNLFDSRRATDMATLSSPRVPVSQEQRTIAKSLNNELRNQFLQNRKRTFVSNVMQPPHLTVSVNAQREKEKDHIMRMAQRANHLTESLVRAPKTEKRQAETIQIETGGQSLSHIPSSQKFKHHDSGFRSIEMSDQTSEGKKIFNVNSVTVKGAYDMEVPRFRQEKVAAKRKRYNVLTGAPEQFVSSSSSHNRKTLLPPQKNFANNGHGKQEYRAGLAASPNVFHRQNGDFTHFQGLKVANSLIASKNFSQKMSSSLFH